MRGYVRLLAMRYLGARNGRGFVSLVSAASLGGLTLGVIALTVVVSVMNGFDAELKRRILGVVPHVTIESASVEDVAAALEDDPRVAGIAPFAAREGLLVVEGRTRLVGVQGIDPRREGQVSIVADHLVQGQLTDLDDGGLIIGRRLAYTIGALPGERVTLVFPRLEGGRVSPDVITPVVVGTFELGSELDYALGLMHVEHVGTPAGVRVTLHDLFDARGVSAELAASGFADVTDWTRSYGDFFRTVRMEKVMMFVLLSMIVAIAAFNIVSSLSILVDEKQADIAILVSMGADDRDVRQVFMLAGATIGILGTSLGIVIGVPFAWYVGDIVGFFESLMGASMLAGTYFDSVPSDVRAPDVVTIAAVVLAISTLATLYPARKAARLKPALVLRHE